MLGDIVTTKPVTNTDPAPAASPGAVSPPVTPAYAVPADDPVAAAVPVASAPTVTKAPKAPLFITLAGAVIFAGGVVGLFIYALSA